MAQQIHPLGHLLALDLRFTGTRGSVLEMAVPPDPQKIWFDKKPRRPVTEQFASGPDGPIQQNWGGGTLEVRSSNWLFTCSVDDAGGVRFANRRRPNR